MSTDLVEVLTRSIGGLTISGSTLSLAITSIRRILKELERGDTTISLKTGKQRTSSVVLGLLCMMFIFILAAASIGTYFILVILFPNNEITTNNSTNT